jgi:hypothetical protein
MTKKFRKNFTDGEKLEVRIKANRKGNREAQLELDNGFTSSDKAFKNKKAYNRKLKFKEVWN